MLPAQICFALTQLLWFCHVSPHSSSKPSPGFWGPNLETIHPMVLRPRPPNHPQVVLHMLPSQHDMCHLCPRPLGHQVFQSSLDLHVCHLDSVNMVTPPCTLALVGVPRCQTLRLVTQPPSLSVQASRPSFTAPRPSARHVPTWPSPHRRPLPSSSNPAHHKPRDMLHNLTHIMVSSQTQPKTWISLTITHHKFEPQGHISILCSHFVIAIGPPLQSSSSW
jgi:hypothetical protein